MDAVDAAMIFIRFKSEGSVDIPRLIESFNRISNQVPTIDHDSTSSRKLYWREIANSAPGFRASDLERRITEVENEARFFGAPPLVLMSNILVGGIQLEVLMGPCRIHVFPPRQPHVSIEHSVVDKMQVEQTIRKIILDCSRGIFEQ